MSSKKKLCAKIIGLEEGWDLVKEGFAKVVRIIDGAAEEKFTSKEYIILYSTIYNLCTQTSGVDEQVYERYKSCINNYIKQKVLPSLAQKHDVYLLGDLVKRWSDHLLMIRWLSRFLHYLDRFYVVRRDLPSLHNAGLECFRELVYSAIRDRAKVAFLSLIYREREGEKIDRTFLKRTVEFFVGIEPGNMKNYEDHLEMHILEDTAAYYARMASNHILKNSCPDYMLMAEQCLKLEDDRASNCLHSSTQLKLIKKVQNELLFAHEVQLLEKEKSGLQVMLRDNKIKDLRRMYELFHPIDGGLDPIASIFRKHIVSDGLALVKQAEDAACNQQVDNESSADLQELVFIKKVFELHDEHLGHIRTCFNDNNLLHKALREAFEVFCNKVIAGMSTSEKLASFSEYILKKGGGSEKSSDEVVEETLDKIVQLLVHIHDKDLFAEFYRKKLARRLIFDRSIGDDHERSILSKLKQHNGAQFTSKMEGMVTDLALAREKQAEFENYLEISPSDNPGIDLSVIVLTTGFWPTYKASDLHLPSELAACVETFKKYYQLKTKCRKLTWITSLGTCTVIGKFDAKWIELIVTTHQAATLMLFNVSERLSFKEIMEQLNVPEDEVSRLLHSLSRMKYKILRKVPDTKSISKNDIFEFNSKFTDRMRRIKVPNIPVDEKKKVMEDVDKDRRFYIDAALVRIMKSRKVMLYQELVTESIKQLSHSFKPDVKLIKRRIEDLVQREYLERDNDDANTFKYVA